MAELEDELTSGPSGAATGAAPVAQSRSSQGGMSYASAAAAPPPPLSGGGGDHPPKNTPLDTVKDLNPALSSGQNGKKTQKKLISPAALERTTPNAAKNQGEVQQYYRTF